MEVVGMKSVGNACKKAGLLLIILSVFWGTASASVNPKIIIDNYTLSETPAVPGHEVILNLHLRDIDTSNCGSMVQVQLSASYPLSIDGSDMQHLADICPDYGNATATFKLIVDPLAQTGTYPVSVVTTYEKDLDKFSESNIINMRVGGAPDFSASVTSSNPVNVYPGDDATVTIKFQNNGAGQAESASATLTAPAGVDVKWAGSTQQMGSIPSRGSASATFSVEAAKDALPGTYYLNATIEYYGEDRFPASQSFSLEMPVLKKADFTADTRDQFVAGEDMDVTIILKNTGSEEARKLKVRIMPIFPFSTDGTVRYIDSLGPGEEKGLNFVVHVDQDGTAGTQTAGLIIDYEDSQGKKFTDTIDVALTVAEKDVAYYLLTYWPLIVLLLIAIIVIRNRKQISGRLAKRRPAKK
jgi:hypothetical protein